MRVPGALPGYVVLGTSPRWKTTAEGNRTVIASAVAAAGAEDPRLTADHVDRARASLDDRHAVPQGELQQRLVGVEAVEDAGVGLVRVAVLVLVLVGRDVQPARDADDRVGVDQARRDDRGREDWASPRAA